MKFFTVVLGVVGVIACAHLAAALSETYGVNIRGISTDTTQPTSGDETVMLVYSFKFASTLPSTNCSQLNMTLSGPDSYTIDINVTFTYASTITVIYEGTTYVYPVSSLPWSNNGAPTSATVSGTYGTGSYSVNNAAGYSVLTIISGSLSLTVDSSPSSKITITATL